MLACGAAYVIDREMGEYQDIYFRADATLQFGYESGYDRDTMLRLCEERGGDPRRPGKSDELDALLWRAARPGEPSWPSRSGLAGQAGMSSAQPSRSVVSEAASTSRAVVAI